MHTVRVLLVALLVSLLVPAISLANTLSIAFLPFEIGGNLETWWWGTHEMLQGIPQRISDKLANDPNLIIIERARIDSILAEHNLQASGAVDSSTAVQLGKLIGADLLVVGTLNEFGFKNQGGLSIRGISLGMSNASVGISARLIDTQTGQILGSFSGSGQDSATSISVSSFNNISFGTSEFDNSVLGKALSKAIDDLVPKFKPALANAQTRLQKPEAVTGKVLAFSGDYIIVNLGANHGIKSSTRFEVYRLQTIEGLSEPIRIPVGKLDVISVDAGASVTVLSEGRDVQIGDTVTPF